jgi:5-methylcytosine-specific restriction endonuclease McrA
MTGWIPVQKNKKHIARERARAKELRKSQWWQDKLNEGICYYCRKQFTREELTMDHIVPVSRGGRSNRGNIVASCKQCNNEKKYLTPVEILMKKINPVKKKKSE